MFSPEVSLPVVPVLVIVGKALTMVTAARTGVELPSSPVRNNRVKSTKRSPESPLSMDRNAPLSEARLLSLHRSVGNAAVGSLIKYAATNPSTSAVQRCVDNQGCACNDAEHESSPAEESIQRNEDETASGSEDIEASGYLANEATDDPCAGWKSDPQSFSIELARLYYRTEYPNPKSPNPSVDTVTGAWDPGVAYWVNFSNGDAVGVSMKWLPTGGPAVACTKKGDTNCFHRCEYSYKCSSSGAISFTKIRCRDS
jgi:hypothetical protein